MVHECQPVLGIVYGSNKPIKSSKALLGVESKERF